MTFDSVHPTLKLFIEKTEKLEESSFLEIVTTNFNLGLSVKVGEAIEVKSFRPQQESIDAFILTFRFFVQDNEPISLRNLREIFKSNLTTEKEKRKFSSIRTELNGFLSESSLIEIKEDKPTNREIMETVLYGELSHTNIEKKERFDRWMDTIEFFQEAIWHRFIITITMVLGAVQQVRNLLCDIINRNNAPKDVM